MDHVNIAVRVQWLEAIATYAWLVVLHEIDYCGNIRDGESAAATTWVEAPSEGMRCNAALLVLLRPACSGLFMVASGAAWAVAALKSIRYVLANDWIRHLRSLRTFVV